MCLLNTSTDKYSCEKYYIKQPGVGQFGDGGILKEKQITEEKSLPRKLIFNMFVPGILKRKLKIFYYKTGNHCIAHPKNKFKVVILFCLSVPVSYTHLEHSMLQPVIL